MKKQLGKRLIALVMATMMTLPMSLVAMGAASGPEAADETYIITIKPSSTTLTPANPGSLTAEQLNGRFQAYQIFTGTVVNHNGTVDPSWNITPPATPNNYQILADVDWGSAFLAKDGKVTGSSMDKHYYGEIKRFLYTLATTDWDAVEGNNLTIAHSPSDNPTPEEMESTTATVTITPSSDEDKLQRVFAEIYKEAFEDIYNFDEEEKKNDLLADGTKGTQAELEEEDKKYACKTAAEEIAKILGAQYGNVTYKEITITPDLINTEMLQKFSKVIDTCINKRDKKDLFDEPVISKWDDDHWYIGDKSLSRAALDSGYYIVIDTLKGEALGEGDSTTPYFLDVIHNVEMTIKSTSPTLNKSISQVSDSSSTVSTAQEDSVSKAGSTAAAGIGDVITFQLDGTLPENFATFYNKYKFVYEDTLDPGLTLELESGSSNPKVKVELSLDNGTTFMSMSEKYAVTYDETNRKLTVTFEDLMQYFKKQSSEGKSTYDADRDKLDTSNKYKGSDYAFDKIKNWNEVIIRVTYNATLNSKAVIGDAEANKNTATLTYTSNPNTEEEGTTPTNTTTTTEETNVYTYEIDLAKLSSVDLGTQPLGSAGFWVSRVNAEGTLEYAIFQLTDSTYKVVYWSSEVMNYINNVSELEDYLNTLKRKLKDIKLGTGDLTVEAFTSEPSNGLKIAGLDQGTYTFTENTAPTTPRQFDKADPFEVTLRAKKESDEFTEKLLVDSESTESSGKVTHSGTYVGYPITNEHPDGSAAEADGTTWSAGLENGIANIVVTDDPASWLPATGGSGVYFYYIVGGLLVVVAAAALLIIRKKSVKKAS